MNNKENNLEEEHECTIKERVCIYMPVELKLQLNELGKKKKMSRNKLSLQIIENYMKQANV